MRRRYPVIASLLAMNLALWGCAESDSERQPPDEPQTETVFDPMLQSLDKAEQAGEVVEGRVEQLDRALEEQEGN